MKLFQTAMFWKDDIAPTILDLFCGAGGAAMGYHRAGFNVVGVDIKPQPNYPFEFIQADALEYLSNTDRKFDAIHASPPCQRYSTMTKRWNREDNHPDMVGETRGAILSTKLPYVIENVVGAPLIEPIILCGSMFGLGSGNYYLRRHRAFETSFDIEPPTVCNHVGQALPVYGHAGGSSKRDWLKFPGTKSWAEGMEIDWMVGRELAESIPPAYTEWIGNHLIRVLGKLIIEV